MRLRFTRFALLCLAALMIVSLCSCELLPDPNAKRTSKLTIDDMMQKQENQGGAFQSIAEIASIKGVPSAISGNLLLTTEAGEETTVSHIYNLELGRKLVSVPNTKSVGFVSSLLQNGKSAEGVYYVIGENVMYIYNSDGSEALASHYSEDGNYSIKDSLMWIAFIEGPGDEIRVRLRSRFVTINEVAELWGGGGHDCAAGATLHSKRDVKKMLAQADERLKNYKENNEGWL